MTTATDRRFPLLQTRIAVALAAVGLIFLGVAWLLYDVALARAMMRHAMNDFGKFYYSARHVLEGRDLYASSPATLIRLSSTEQLNLGNLNPPHFHLLILPLSLWGPNVALVLWSMASLTSLVLAARTVLRELGWPALSPARLGLTLFGTVAWVGTGSVIATGQSSLFLLWPMAAGWGLMRRGRWLRSGVVIGLLASVKPFLGLLLVYFLVRRQYRALAAGALALAAAFCVGLAVFGADAQLSWIRTLQRVDWSWLPMNASVAGLIARVLAPNTYLSPIFEWSAAIRPLGLAVAATGIGVTLVSVIRRPNDVDRSFLLLTLAALLFSPLGWVYYVWFLLPPLFAMWQRGVFSRQRPWLIPALFAAFWPVSATTIGQANGLATATLASVYCWGLISLWLSVLRAP
jgi:alpha-1,2-mannosyltransferase